MPAGPGVSLDWNGYTRHYGHEVKLLCMKRQLRVLLRIGRRFFFWTYLRLKALLRSKVKLKL